MRQTRMTVVLTQGDTMSTAMLEELGICVASPTTREAVQVLRELSAGVSRDLLELPEEEGGTPERQALAKLALQFSDARR